MPGVDVQEVMRAIRERVRAKALRKAAAAEEEGAPAPPLPDLIHVRGHIAHTAAKFHRVGEMPPSPETFRARMGGHAVRMVKRSLFWLTAQLHEAHEALLQTERSQADAMQLMIDSQHHHALQIETIRHAMARQQQVNVAVQCQWEDMIPQWDEMGIGLKRVRGDVESLAIARDRLIDRDEELADEVERLRLQVATQAQAIEELREKQRPPEPIHELLYRHGEHFRGSSATVKQRLAVYLPHLAKLPAGAKAVDIGCGRGEWLELCREQGIEAVGIDSNPLLIACCRENGLPAHEQSGMEYLRSVPGDSLDLVTAFHVIEHMPFAAFLALLREARRTLRLGGSLVLETPNATSLFVGSHTFHLDPTHERLLPPQLLEFLLAYEGFENITPLALQPFPEHFLLPPDASGIGQRLNEYLYGGQDFGILATKAAATGRTV